MKHFFLERRLKKLEEVGNDDFQLIMEFGAEAYSTPELHRILADVNQRAEQAARWQYRLFLIGFSISLCIGAAFLAAAAGAKPLSMIFLAGVPLAIGLLVLGHFLLRRYYPTYRHTHLLASIIQQELDRRRKDASIY
jgi:hypothetical protein